MPARNDKDGLTPDRRLAWAFRFLWFFYALLLALQAYFHNAPTGRIIFWVLASSGGWVGVYCYLTREDIVFYNTNLTHEKNPTLRFFVFLIFVAGLLLVPAYLYG